MPDPDPYELRDLAERVAREAGRLVSSRRVSSAAGSGIGAVETKSTPTDVVTAMDRAAEELIRASVLTARPDDGFLGEEGAASGGTTGVRWIVDPIDGTVNFLYGIPAYAVSVAAEHDGEVVAGVVHNPVSGETWTATRGGGAFLDGAPIAVRPATELRFALVATGFGYAAESRAVQAAIAARLLPRVRDIRRCGAASLDLCAVATGRLDGYYEQGLMPWDLAAAGLVAREAGARVEGAYGRPPSSALVIATSPAIFDALHAEVAELASR